MVIKGHQLEKEGMVPKRLQDEVDDMNSTANMSKKVMKNMVTIYNQDTFEIAKIRVNRVITINSLMAKIASHYELDNPKDIVLRFGDLNLTFDANSGDKELSKLLFKDLPSFSEQNLIGV